MPSWVPSWFCVLASRDRDRERKRYTFGYNVPGTLMTQKYSAKRKGKYG